MVRNPVRVLVVLGLLGTGWVVGYAQAPTSAPSVSSDFELLVATGDRGTEVRCVRGCSLTWAPTGVDILAPDVRVRGTVNPNGCISPEWSSDNCRILGWQR
jgi:hypothetical protein